MQPKASVELKRALGLSRARNRDRGTHRMVVLIRVRNNDIEAVDRAAKEHHDQALLPGVRVLNGPAARSERQ